MLLVRTSIYRFTTIDALRKRFKPALPCTGNFCSTVVNVDAIPGSNVKFALDNCTISGQSPSTTLQIHGGGYAGGLIQEVQNYHYQVSELEVTYLLTGLD